VILVAAPNAAGQAALDQYIPKGNPAGGDKGGGSLDNPVIPPAPNGGERAHKRISDIGPGTDKGGKLPLTDYPGTPFLWIVIAVLVAAALIRIGIELKKRRGALTTG
jgi:hypothetical protein